MHASISITNFATKPNLQKDSILFSVICCSSIFQYMRGLRNFDNKEPHQHAIYYANHLMAELEWTITELLHSAAGQIHRYMSIHQYI